MISLKMFNNWLTLRSEARLSMATACLYIKKIAFLTRNSFEQLQQKIAPQKVKRHVEITRLSLARGGCLFIWIMIMMPIQACQRVELIQDYYANVTSAW